MKLIKRFRQLVESAEKENVSVDIYSFVDKSLSGFTFPGTKKQMIELIPLLVSYTDKTNYAWLQISKLLSIPGFTDKIKETLLTFNPYERGLNYKDILYRVDKDMLFTKNFIDYLLTKELSDIDIKFIFSCLCAKNNAYITYFLENLKNDSRKLWDALMIIADIAENKKIINRNLELFLHNISDFNYILGSTNLTPVNQEKVMKYIDKYIEEYNDYLTTHFKEIVKINTVYDKTKEITPEGKEQALKDNEHIVDMIMMIIDEICKNEGVKYKDIKYVGGGYYSNAYQIGDKIIKIGYIREKFTFPNNPYIIAPLFRKRIPLKNSNVEELYIEVQERVELLNNENYTQEEIYQLYKNIRNLGLIWFDVEPRNVGRLLKDNIIHWNSEIAQIDEVLGFEPKRGDKILKAGELVILDADFIFDYSKTPERYFEYDWSHTKNQRMYEARYQKELNSVLEEGKEKHLTL